MLTVGGGFGSVRMPCLCCLRQDVIKARGLSRGLSQRQRRGCSWRLEGYLSLVDVCLSLILESVKGWIEPPSKPIESPL
jgi:hypothetical protein